MNKVIGIIIGIIIVGAVLFIASESMSGSDLPENDTAEKSETQTGGRSINLELNESVGITATP